MMRKTLVLFLALLLTLPLAAGALASESYGKKPDVDTSNVITTFGPRFRDLNKRLTEEWFMFTPVTLEEGTQEFDMIAGNMYVVGTVSVIVKGDEVSVRYKYRKDNTRSLSEFYTWFPDFETIASAELEDIGDSLTFKKPYSISQDLGGDTEVILIVRNKASFTIDPSDPKWKGNDRFWENTERYIEQLKEMMTQIGY